MSGPACPILGSARPAQRPERHGDEPHIPMAATSREVVQPEVLEPVPDAAGGPPARRVEGEQVTRPTKLIRIATMVRTMLDEVRRAPLDDAGRRRLREIHERSVNELEEVLSPELRQELSDVVCPSPARHAERIGAAPRAGPARRLARRPLPWDPGDALHPAGGGAAAARARCGAAGRWMPSGIAGARRRASGYL